MSLKLTGLGSNEDPDRWRDQAVDREREAEDARIRKLRQLDRWIAINLFGWQWWRFRMHKKATAQNAGRGYDRWQQLVPPNENWYRQLKWGGIHQPQGEGQYLEDETGDTVPKYSSESAPAMEVLKKCMEVTAVVLGTESGKPSCGDKADVFGLVVADTLQEAICLFAEKLFTAVKTKQK